MLIDKLLSLVAPHECLARLPDGQVCGREGRLVCPGCLDRAVAERPSTCWHCDQPTVNHLACALHRHRSCLLRVAAATHYNGLAKELIGQLKFHNNVAAADVCAELVAPHVRGRRYDLVTAVPVATSRRRVRGYNQAALIAKSVAARLDLPYFGVLARLGQSRQVGAPRHQRLRQVAGMVYACQPRLTTGQRILLVDDILTTGATMSECAKVLRVAGAKRVEGAVVARH